LGVQKAIASARRQSGGNVSNERKVDKKGRTERPFNLEGDAAPFTKHTHP